MQTTLKRIREHGLASGGLEKLTAYLEARYGEPYLEEEPFPLLRVLESNGFEAALQSLRGVDGFEKEIREMALAFVRPVVRLMKSAVSRRAVLVAEALARGEPAWEERAEAICEMAKMMERKDAWTDHADAACYALLLFSKDEMSCVMAVALFSALAAASSAENAEDYIRILVDAKDAQEAELRKLLEMET